jgi:hypothetical protein
MPQPTPLSSNNDPFANPDVPIGKSVSPFDALPQPAEDHFATTRKWLLELVAEAEKIDHDLPVDLAENHDHYLHGLPRK